MRPQPRASCPPLRRGRHTLLTVVAEWGTGPLACPASPPRGSPRAESGFDFSAPVSVFGLKEHGARWLEASGTEVSSRLCYEPRAAVVTHAGFSRPGAAALSSPRAAVGTATDRPALLCCGRGRTGGLLRLPKPVLSAFNFNLRD